MQSDPWVNMKIAASHWQERHDAAQHWRTICALTPTPTRRTWPASLSTGARNVLRISGATAATLLGGAASQFRERVARQRRELDLN